MPSQLLTPQRAAALCRVPRSHLAGEGRGQGDPYRRRGRHAAEIAAKVDNADKKYWDEQIKPLVDASPWVEYIARSTIAEAGIPVRRACPAVPIDWPEPFGLVMIEAMACGTPVIAFNAGPCPR